MNNPMNDDVTARTKALGVTARAVLPDLAASPLVARNAALMAAAAALDASHPAILAANGADMDKATTGPQTTPAFLDRLRLDDGRIDAMARGLRAIAGLDDPLGRTLARWQRPNGLEISRLSVPIGVVGIIYEARPNVTADAGGLCLKAGNAVILRGGSASLRSSRAIHRCLLAGLSEAGLPAAAIQMVADGERSAVGAMLAMSGLIDVIIPRGGKSLTERVQADSRVPVLAHMDGICHTYIHAAAEAEKARAIVLNAKMRRPGICGATETLLIDAAIAPRLLPLLADDLTGAGCELRGDARASAIDSRIGPPPANWDTEYLDAILAIRVVDDIEAALDHIAAHGSGHTEAIVTGNEAAATQFLQRVDAAIVIHNASTQFADGGEFGMGAEIGIATGRLHARGPVGLEQLTTYKYVLRGSGQVRDL